MSNSHLSLQRPKHNLPIALGAGLLALDVVVNLAEEGATPQYFAGGTCGNVLTILNYLGWRSKPIGRLASDSSAEYLIRDLQKWGVDVSLITRTEDGSTPVIIQRIKSDPDGNRVHSFSLRCPCCGAYLPGYKSILAANAGRISDSGGDHRVFFFDRVSRGTLQLAKASASRGAVVFFEPSGIGDPKLFREAWSLAHIVKYSQDRLQNLAEADLREACNQNGLLEIQTRGEKGLRYRGRLIEDSPRWQSLPAIHSSEVKDAAGSGDWCSAGIIHRLTRGGLRGFRQVGQKRLVEALRFGQALAAWNCLFEGARGGMYHVSKSLFERQVRKLTKGEAPRLEKEELTDGEAQISKLCPSCETTGFSRCYLRGIA